MYKPCSLNRGVVITERGERNNGPGVNISLTSNYVLLNDAAWVCV